MPREHIFTAELVYRKIRGYAQLDAINDFCRRRRKSFGNVEEEDEDEEENEDDYGYPALDLGSHADDYRRCACGPDLFAVVAIRSLHDASKAHDAALDEHNTMLEAFARSIEVLTRRCDIAVRRHCQQRLKAERRAQKGLTCKKA